MKQWDAFDKAMLVRFGIRWLSTRKTTAPWDKELRLTNSIVLAVAGGDNAMDVYARAQRQESWRVIEPCNNKEI